MVHVMLGHSVKNTSWSLCKWTARRRSQQPRAEVGNRMLCVCWSLCVGVCVLVAVCVCVCVGRCVCVCVGRCVCVLVTVCVYVGRCVCVLVAVCVLGCCVCVLGRCGVACCWPCVYEEEVGSSRSTLQTEMKVNMSTYCRKKSEYENIFRSSELGKVKAW